jgi:hypothetical protein
MWTVKVNKHSVWRSSLESSSTGEKWGFADLDELCTFLRQQTQEGSDARDTGGEE